MINECKNFSLEYLKLFSNNMLVLSGKNDIILNIKYNYEFCKRNVIKEICFETSHSLYEKIEDVFKCTIDYFLR